MPVLETHSEHRGHWCGSWNHHEISHLGHEFEQYWKVTSCLTVQFSFWSELPSSVLTPQFCGADGADPALQDLSREPCTVLISLRGLRRASWAPPLSQGQPCLLCFHWQVLRAPSQELLTHFIQCGSRKKKLLTKPAFITTLLSHASLFFPDKLWRTNLTQQSLKSFPALMILWLLSPVISVLQNAECKEKFHYLQSVHPKVLRAHSSS